MLLLAAAGGAIEAFLHLMHTSLGYDPSNTMSVGIPVHENTYKTWAERAAYFTQLQQRVAAVPGVMEAAISTNATPPSNGYTTKFEILGKPALQENEALLNFIGPGYFQLLRIPLNAGRIFDESETMRGAHLAVINETMARRYWPNGDAVGHSLRMPRLKGELPFTPAAEGSDSWMQIAGVVSDARDDGLNKPVRPAIYLPYTIAMPMHTQVLVRARSNPLALLPAIRTEIKALNPDQQVFHDVQDLNQWITDQPEWAQEHLIAWLFAAFAFVALALAAIGLYSVLSYGVVQRSKEFGIRMALGARKADVLRTVFSSAVMNVAIGIFAGLFLSVALGKLTARWIEGFSNGPSLLAAVSAVMICVAAIACLIPARRAAAVDPMVALRGE
jgi:predicted permease